MIIRSVQEYVDKHINMIRQRIQIEDAVNITHLETCDGCEECEALMDFYSGCSTCDKTGHKDAMLYDPENGEYICKDCNDKEYTLLLDFGNNCGGT